MSKLCFKKDLRKETNHMKRICAVLCALCLGGLLLVGCSKSSNTTATYDVNEVASAVAEAAVVENPTAFTEDDLIYDIDIDPENVVEFAGVRTLTNGTSGAVLVIKAKSGQADTIKAQLEAYRDGIVSVWENYKSDFPIGYEQTKNGRVVEQGDYVVLAIAGSGVDYTAVDQAIADALK
jgi:hypothetical protein